MRSPPLAKALALFLLAVAMPGSAQDAKRALDGIPGLDFSRLPPNAQKELAAVFTDEFDYCGKPLTLAAALKKPDACKHSRRMAVFAASRVADGDPATELINALARYNESFKAKRTTFKPDDRLCKGPKDAKVTVVEYSDFECPYCNAARPLVEQLLKRPDVRVCWQAFPLSGHPNAVPAANAALFARDADKFWKVHDSLFDNQLTLSSGVIEGIVKSAGLDPKAFVKAMTDKKYDEEIAASKALAKTAGVDATPSFYFNGRKLTLHPSAESLSLALDDELEWQANKSAWASN